MSLTEDAKQLHGDLVRLRRELHAAPEVGLHLPRTQERVLAALDGLPLEVGTGTALTSVTAVLRGGRPGPTGPAARRHGRVAGGRTCRRRLRLDGSRPHARVRARPAHLDVVGAAHLLSARREHLAGDVVFMFQPGEEGYDGAGHMLAEGVLEASGSRPVAAYGLHVSASEPQAACSSRARAR